MIVFKKITLQNFLSYGNDNAEVRLDQTEPTLISGINYDASTNGELDSNGAGKSSILMGLSTALYDKAIGIDNPKKSGLINNINNKDMLITLELVKGKKTYIISRYRKNKSMGGDGVRIEEDGKDITPDSVANANKYIANHIMEIPFEIFSKIVVYAAGQDSFLKMNLATQRNIMEELFSYKELSNKAEVLKDKIKNNKSDLEYAKESNADIKEEHARHLKQLDDTEKEYADWQTSYEDQVLSCKKQLEETSDIDFEAELENMRTVEANGKVISTLETTLADDKRTLNDLNAETRKHKNMERENTSNIKSTEDALAEFNISDSDLEKNRESLEKITQNQNKLVKFKDEANSTNRTISRLNREKDTFQNDISKLDESKCPYCSQAYAEAKNKKEEIVLKLSTVEEDLLEENSILDKLNEGIIKLENKIETLKTGLAFTTLKEINEYQSRKSSLTMRLENYKALKNPYEDNSDKISEAEDVVVKAESKLKTANDEREKLLEGCLFKTVDELYKVKNKVDGTEEKLKYLSTQDNPYKKVLESLKGYTPKDNKDKEIDNLIDEIRHQEFLLKLLTKKDSFIRKALMDKYLPFLNERLKYYLSLVGLPHKVQFTSDLSTEISQFGKEIPYSNLSSGQKARIDITLSLAFRDVLQSKHNFINLFILDECLDVGLSNVGVKKTLKVIKDVAKNNKLSMFIISHRDEIKDSFKARLDVELRNGFSSVVQT